MDKICLSYDEYDDLMFYEGLYEGSYGKLIKFSDDILLKLYHERYIELRTSRTPINHIQSKYNEELDKIQNKMNVLSETKMSDLFKGIVECNNCIVGLMIKYYKDYVPLEDIIGDLDNNQKIEVLSKVKTIFESFLASGCYYMDMRLANILVRKKDLDIKIIDLDDVHTQFEFDLDDKYIKQFVNRSIASYEILENKILRR